jgi:hypothetical protein
MSPAKVSFRIGQFGLFLGVLQHEPIRQTVSAAIERILDIEVQDCCINATRKHIVAESSSRAAARNSLQLLVISATNALSFRKITATLGKSLVTIEAMHVLDILPLPVSSFALNKERDAYRPEANVVCE